MKALSLFIVLFAANFAVAAPKDESCNRYVNVALANYPAAIQLPAIAEVMNVAYELNLNADEMKKFMDFLEQRVKTDSTALDNLGKNAYFACTTDLTADDKKAISEQLFSILGIRQ